MIEDPFLFRLNYSSTTLYNMVGDYKYLTQGYYHSLDYELNGCNIKPTTEEVLDAYVVPLAMKKAEYAGIKIPKYEIVNDKISPPVLAYPINPFTTKSDIIKNSEEVKTKMKTLTMGGKYAALCQALPDDYQLKVVRSILGLTIDPEFAEFAGSIFRVFQIPLMKIQVIISGKDYLFSAIEPLTIKELDKQERYLLEENGKWQE